MLHKLKFAAFCVKKGRKVCFKSAATYAIPLLHENFLAAAFNNQQHSWCHKNFFILVHCESLSRFLEHKKLSLTNSTDEENFYDFSLFWIFFLLSHDFLWITINIIVPSSSSFPQVLCMHVWFYDGSNMMRIGWMEKQVVTMKATCDTETIISS